MDPHLFIRSYFFHPLQKQSGLFWCGSHRHNTIFQNPLSSPTGPQSFGVIQTTSLAIFESMQHEKKTYMPSVYRCIVIFMSSAYYFDIQAVSKTGTRKSSRLSPLSPKKSMF